MSRLNIKFQRGQAIVLVVLAMIALLAMLALVLDGGSTFMTRRAMQNAADAGALAGARALCVRPSYGCAPEASDATCATFFASQYATVHNTAQGAQVWIDPDPDNKRVVVTATRDVDTFFAHFIGQDEVPVQASAEAACCPPTTGESILPVAWACRPPINDDLSDKDDCQEQVVDFNYAEDRRTTNPPTEPPDVLDLYLIMDSNAQPTDLRDVCISLGGWLNCDLDGDGEDDLIANGAKSWLDLDGSGGGASSLSDWIDNGFPGVIKAHTWTGGQTGTANSVFQTAGDHEGEIVFIPVFNLICDGDPSTECPGDVHSQDTIVHTAGGNYYYHIISFAAFYISCVNASGVQHAPDTALSGNECPGHKIARDLNVFADVTGGNNPHNPKTIEGYFLDDFPSGAGGGDCTGGIDTGAYILSLTK